MNTPDRHLTDEEIIRLVDEKVAPEDLRATGHLDRCEACRARIGGFEALLAALRAEPPVRPEAELAAQRDRILRAVRAWPRAPVRRLRRWSLWLPAVAAAAISSLLIWAPRGTRSPWTAPTANLPAESTTLPVIVDATRAAEEVAQAADDPETAERPVTTPPLDAAEPDLAASISDGWSETLEIEEEFAGLPVADRQAILTELASLDFINVSEE